MAQEGLQSEQPLKVHPVPAFFIAVLFCVTRIPDRPPHWKMSFEIR